MVVSAASADGHASGRRRQKTLCRGGGGSKRTLKVTEPRLRRWGRRALTLPAVFVGLGVLLAGLPMLRPVAALVDLLGGGKSKCARFLLAVTWVLGCEAVGIVASGWFWLRRLAGLE